MMDKSCTAATTKARILKRGRFLCCVATLGLLTAGAVYAQSEVEPVPVTVVLVANEDETGGQYVLLSGLAPHDGVSLNLPYAAITDPIRLMVVNETPEQTMAVEVFDSTGMASAPGVIEHLAGLATANFRVEGEYSVQIKATGDEPVAYTFLLWVMPTPKQVLDDIYTKRSE